MGMPREHLGTMMTPQFTADEFWQPEGCDYTKEQVFEMMTDIESTYQREEDPLAVTTEQAEEPFEEEVINIVVQKSQEQYMSFSTEDGQNQLLLCLDDTSQCVKARIVMIASNMPGFRFSRFQSFMFLLDQVLIPQRQFHYLIERFTGRELAPEDIPASTLYVKL